MLAPQQGAIRQAIDDLDRVDSEMLQTTPKRNHPMGDKKSKKDKAKAQRQKGVKDAKTAKRKQDKQQPRAPQA